MEFRILGPLEVVKTGRALDLGGQKQRALLACLLLNANEVVSTDRLLEALWEESPPERAQKALHVYVSQLRKLLGRQRIETRPPGYLLRVAEQELDLARCRTLLEAGKPEEALALWRGPPLADFAYSRFAQAEIARLEELRLACLEERVEQELARGRHAALVGEVEALVREHPLRERLRRQLMVALYRSGRQAEALEAYQDARRALTEELGIEPGRELRKLQQAVLRQDPALERPAQAREAGEHARGVFVGRERELAELHEALDEALGGRGALVLVSGEPGIGKSRLADELIRQARARGAQILVGRCWEAGGAPAYWPWVQALRPLVEHAQAEQLRRELGTRAAELAQLLPELRELIPDLPEPPALESDVGRFRLFDAVAGFLGSASQRRALVLVLDDLHAADEPSLLMLRFLAAEVARSRLLLVCLFRDADPTLREPLVSTLAELTRVGDARRIALAGLSEQEVSGYMQLTSGVAPPPRLARAIHHETEGNPLFVAEVVRLLAAEGRLADDGAHLRIPHGIQAVIERRAGRLSERCRDVLLGASVFGRELRLDALAELSGLERDELLHVLDEAVAERVLGEVPGAPGRLRFGHALIRDALYEALTPTKRLWLHRKAGEALEVVYRSDPEPHLAELAHHFVAAAPAGARDKAIGYARRAGERAASQLAYEEAVRLYEMALALSEDALERCELLVALADAQTAAGDAAAGVESFLAAAEIARGLGSSDLLARSALGCGGRFVWSRAGGDPRLVSLLRDALEAVGPADSSSRARLLARYAMVLRGRLDPEEQDAISREAVEMARRLDDPGALSQALLSRRISVWEPARAVEDLDLCDEVNRLAEAAGDWEHCVEARLLRSHARLVLGDLRGVYADLDEAVRLAADRRVPSVHWHINVHQAELALLQGRFSEAEQLIRDALALGRRAERADALGSHATQSYALRRELGGVEEVEAFLTRLADDRPGRALPRCLLAELDWELGRERRARAALSGLVAEGCRAIAPDLEWALCLATLAEVAASLGDREAAGVLYEQLLPAEDLVVIDPHEFSRGAAARPLGLLAATCGRVEEAERHFLRALELNEAIGARPWLAHTQQDYARLLLARGAPGDAEQAWELLGQALSTYRELGMAGPLAKAEALAAAR